MQSVVFVKKYYLCEVLFVKNEGSSSVPASFVIRSALVVVRTVVLSSTGSSTAVLTSY